MSDDAQIVEVDPSNPALLGVSPMRSGKRKFVPFFEITKDIETGDAMWGRRSTLKFILREPKLLQPFSSKFLETVETQGNLWLVLPNEFVSFCAPRECEGCPHWPICFIGDLPMGKVGPVKLDRYHLQKRCMTGISWMNPGSTAISLTVHALNTHEYPLKDITSQYKDQFFPQTRKDETGAPKDSSDV